MQTAPCRVQLAMVHISLTLVQTRAMADDMTCKQLAMRPPTTIAQARAMASGLAAGGLVTSKPAGSRVIFERSPARLDITIPPKVRERSVEGEG